MKNDFKKRENDLILNNQRLVYHLSQKFASHPLYDKDDFASVGMIGLIKAAHTYDDSKNVKFATYASTCINNEILMYIRKNKAFAETAYLEDIINTDNEGNTLTLEDLIPLGDSDFTNILPEIEQLENLLSIVLNYFSGRNRLLWLYTMGGVTQTELSNIFGISQSYISRIGKINQKKLKILLKSKLNFEELFFPSITQNYLLIHFSVKTVKNFNIVFSNFLRNRIPNRELLEFKVKRIHDTVTIQLPCDFESFSFIADFLRELETNYP